jgi:hypothetical protein
MQQEQPNGQTHKLGINPQDAQGIKNAAHQLVPNCGLSYPKDSKIMPSFLGHDKHVL